LQQNNAHIFGITLHCIAQATYIPSTVPSDMTGDKKQPFLSLWGGNNGATQEDSEPPFNWPNMFEESKEMMEGMFRSE
jgi:hypothetical protein